MYFVLTIPELLENVFRHTDRGSLARSLRVSKQWHVIGRGVLWQNLEGSRHFEGAVSLLGGLKELYNYDSDEIEQRLFIRYPQAGDWAKFVQHANFVRVMSLEGMQKYYEVFRVMAESKPSFALFPNAHTLKYTATYQDIQYCIHFIHPNIKRFTFNASGLNYVPRSQFSDYLQFLIDAIPRMSMLQHIEFNAGTKSRDSTNNHLVSVIRGIRTLHSIILPRYTLTAPILDQLSSLPQLEVLRMNKTIGSSPHKVYEPFEPDLSPNSFPALRALTLWAKPNDITQFLSSHSFVSKLHALALDLVDVNPEDLLILLNVVVETCSALREISVVTSTLVSSVSDPDPASLTVNCFAPLLSCINLVDIEIEHEGNFSFTTAELDNLAGRIPHVERLVLRELLATLRTDIHLPHLLIFARQCPKLRTLGLTIDATKVHNLPSEDLPEFKSLRCLELGKSVIRNDDIDSVAFFLAQILPLECRLKTRDFSHWKQVANVLPLLVRMRVFKSKKPTERM